MFIEKNKLYDINNTPILYIQVYVFLKKGVEKENITCSFNLIVSNNSEAKKTPKFSLCLMFQMGSSKGLGKPGSA